MTCGYLSEQEGLLVVDGVESVGGHHAGAELFSDGVGRQPIHVHLHVRAHFALRQELARYHLQVTIS